MRLLRSVSTSQRKSSRYVYWTRTAQCWGCVWRDATLSSNGLQRVTCAVAMEACSNAHHWGRWFASRGHVVCLIVPEFIEEFRKGGKNDSNDAEAIAIACRQPIMRRWLECISEIDLSILKRSCMSATAHRNRTGRGANPRLLLGRASSPCAADHCVGASQRYEWAPHVRLLSWPASLLTMPQGRLHRSSMFLHTCAQFAAACC